jgi:hypothetical protein
VRAAGGQIWRTANGTDWEYVTSVEKLEGWNKLLSFGSGAMADLCVFDDDNDGVEELFAGTWRLFGFSVYRYDPDTDRWSRAAEFGIDKWSNMAVQKLVPFNGRLWILTVNILDGFDIYASDPSNPAVGIRNNGDWELVATRGFNDPGNYYAWNAIVYPVGPNGEELSDSRLFIGTFRLTGFTLFSVTKNGEWAIEARYGLTNPINYGARTFAIYNDNLIIGTAGVISGTAVYSAH